MGRGKKGHTSICPNCQTASTCVLKYGTRTVKHYTIGGISTKSVPFIAFRCCNDSCTRKTFTHYNESDKDDLLGKSTYSKSTQNFVANKMLKHPVSYNSFQKQIVDDFNVNTSISTIYTWSKKASVIESLPDLAEVSVLNTDEKHPKKKSSANTQFIIASAGKNKETPSARLLHLTSAASNDIEAITAHYKGLIDKGLDPEKVKLVVTDMLIAYMSVIKIMFPNALHQFCVFHVLQTINGLFKEALKHHRYAHFKEGERKEAHKIALYMLKGQEKLTAQESEKVLDFCEKYPDVMANYGLKEDIRALYALSKSEIQAVAYRDIIIENYQDKISEPMQKILDFLTQNFENTISYLKVNIHHAKTNNDAERIMRKIERNQNIHYFFRNEESLIRHLKTRLGINIPIAA